MRIVMDMQGAQTGSRFRGIGRYTVALAKAMIRHRGEHDMVLLLNGLLEDSVAEVRSAFEGLLPPDSILTWTAPDPVHPSDPHNQGREELAKLLRETMIASLQPDMVWISSFFEGYTDNAVASIRQLDAHTPVCTIAYDFIPLLYPDQYLDHDPAYARYYRDKVEQLRQADLLLAISESSRSEAIAQLAVGPDRVVNIAAACDPCFRPMADRPQGLNSLPPHWGVTRGFVLYTGGTDERKNLARLIQAFAAMPHALRHQHQLLFAGKLSPAQQGELLSTARQHGLTPDALCFTGYVSDEELVLAYNLCQLFVFPSWHEGFGLPPLEAMACGAPVIAANTSSLPEVVGWDAALFDPFDVDAISRKMAQALSDADFRSRLISHARRQAQAFSWDASAQVAISAMAALHRQRMATADQAHVPQQRVGYAQWLSASAAALKKHGLVRTYDLSSLAACMAHNESEVERYQKARVESHPSAQVQGCEN